MLNRLCSRCFFTSLILLAGCNDASSPTFQIAAGFEIQKVASEPLITDPVAMDIDEKGDMYVVEMRGMPLDKSGLGRVMKLSDRNHDGIMDESLVFADSLVMPSGVMKWKNGIIVTDPPHVLYFEDANGDGQADLKKILLTGFDTSNLEANVNTPLYGMDGWIYLANGGNSNTDIHFADGLPGPVLKNNSNGSMVRFRPETRELEAASGYTQYGHSFDRWGRHFLINNYNHIFQEVIEDKYLKRNPALLVPSSMQALSDHKNSADVFPIIKDLKMELLSDVGQFTSGCGIACYDGGVFPGEYSNAVFEAEPAHSIVHVDKLTEKGPTFTASRIEEKKEFLASSDPMFRPVFNYSGPDGALYVVDFYRQHIEGPEFMDEAVLKQNTLYNGNDKGRIYRITATGQNSNLTRFSDLSLQSNYQLAENLRLPNGWYRKTSQRLLVDRQAVDTKSQLINIASAAELPESRIQALMILNLLHSLEKDLVIKKLFDMDPHVRTTAIKLSENFIADPQIDSTLLTLEDEKDGGVQFQLLCTLGFNRSKQATLIRHKILFRSLEDPWIQVAALSAVEPGTHALLDSVIRRYSPGNSALQNLVRLLGAKLSASGNLDEITKTVHRTIDDNHLNIELRRELLEGLANGFAGNTKRDSRFDPLRTLIIKKVLSPHSAELKRALLVLLEKTGVAENKETGVLINKAISLANNTAHTDEERAFALELVALQNAGAHLSVFARLQNPQLPIVIQIAALGGLDKGGSSQLPTDIIKQWPQLSPEVRDASLNTFFNDRKRVATLLDAVDQGIILPGDLGWSRSVDLMGGNWKGYQQNDSIDMALIKKARSLLARKDEDRKPIIEAYLNALSLKGDPRQGKVIYQHTCAVCHQLGGKFGNAFGPDLGTVKDWPGKAIITSVIDPGLSIARGFDLWDFTLDNGVSVRGIISSESGNALTIRAATGSSQTIQKSIVLNRKQMYMSAMPTGLEKQLSIQEMSHLIAFIKNRTVN